MTGVTFPIGIHLSYFRCCVLPILADKLSVEVTAALKPATERPTEVSRRLGKLGIPARVSNGVLDVPKRMKDGSEWSLASFRIDGMGVLLYEVSPDRALVSRLVEHAVLCSSPVDRRGNLVFRGLSTVLRRSIASDCC